jgi:hypothetical protein
MGFYAALVDADPEEHWYDAKGNVLQPSRWISADEQEELWQLLRNMMQALAELSESR